MAGPGDRGGWNSAGGLSRIRPIGDGGRDFRRDFVVGLMNSPRWPPMLEGVRFQRQKSRRGAVIETPEDRMSMPSITVVIPAYNEEHSIGAVIEALRPQVEKLGHESEIVVVVDGATDGTAAEARRYGVRVVEHPQNLGYGRSLKTGISAARNELIAITDADTTYPVDRIPEMVELAAKFDMVVGARQGRFYQGGVVKRLGRFVFRKLAEFATGQSIPDINSGLRVFRRSQMIPFFPIISAGFSFTTTSTLAYMLNDLCVCYLPIAYHKRAGRSKVRHLRDSLRALQIIVEAILRINPIKVFLLLALPFALVGLGAFVMALLRQSGTWALMSVMALCTSGLVMGLGFLAVSMAPQRRHFHGLHPDRPETDRDPR